VLSHTRNASIFSYLTVAQLAHFLSRQPPVHAADKVIELGTHVVLIVRLEEYTRKFLDHRGKLLFTRSIAAVEVANEQLVLSKVEYAKI